MIEANLVVCRNIAGAAVGGVDEWAGQRMPRAVQRRVKLQVAVRKFDAAVGLAGNVGGMRNHQDRVAGVVPLPENFEDGGFVGFVAGAGGRVGEGSVWLVGEG